MIAFDLQCQCGYQFEGWFADRNEFLRQQQERVLECPLCGGPEVVKILSPVAVRTKSNAPSQMEPLAGGLNEQQVITLLRHVDEYVKKNFDDVGADLAKEALKIHYGVKASRNIRGVVTQEEENMLAEEGVELLKVPILSDSETEN